MVASSVVNNEAIFPSPLLVVIVMIISTVMIWEDPLNCG
jgi:hypothetical protein